MRMTRLAYNPGSKGEKETSKHEAIRQSGKQSRQGTSRIRIEVRKVLHRRRQRTMLKSSYKGATKTIWQEKGNEAGLKHMGKRDPGETNYSRDSDH